MVNKTLRNKTLNRKITVDDKYLANVINLFDGDEITEDIKDATILGDTFEALSKLPKEHFDLIVADPPYNLLRKYHGTPFAKMDTASYEAFTRKWLELVYPLLREGGSIYVCCDWQSGMIIGRVLGEMFTLQNRITWQREKGRGAKKNWKSACEDIWYATKGEGATFNLNAVKLRRRVLAPYRLEGEARDWMEEDGGKFRDTCPSNFWDDLTVPFWSMEENTAHPTQKPEKLVAKIILASSNEGDTMLDPFLGSGTTSVVAKKLRRHYVGIEQNPTYCAWAEERLERADEDKRIQGYDGKRFYERHALIQKKKKTKAGAKSSKKSTT